MRQTQSSSACIAALNSQDVLLLKQKSSNERNLLVQQRNTKDYLVFCTSFVSTNVRSYIASLFLTAAGHGILGLCI